nr:SWF/SNF helicase family protein [Gemmatimonadales bacterium]
ALAGALRRYRGLLLHARDALAAGRPLNRAAIRRFTGEAGDQLCWWEFLPDTDVATELELADLGVMDAVLAEARAAAAARDGKLERLRALLADGAPTLVFAARRETVTHLRDKLADLRIAWCTGERAGLGATALPRSVVLGWFREGGNSGKPRPSDLKHLAVTDVAAEGLDLQRAARVVHYDLPWTPMRLDQREGRALRLGSPHPLVEIVRFGLPAALERALRLEEALRRKRRLPDAAGLGVRGWRLWRWRAELGEAMELGDAVPGVAALPNGPEGVLAGFGIHARCAGREERLAFTLIWIHPNGRWTEDEEIVAARLSAAIGSPAAMPDAGRLRTALELLAEPVRSRLTAARERRWAEADGGAPARVVAARLQQAIREAARQRDANALSRLERALGFVAGGHTAGETMLLERLAERSAAEIVRGSAGLPAPTPHRAPVEARLEGLLLFVPERSVV